MIRRLSFAALATAVCAAVFASPAAAGLVVPSADACEDRAWEQPFLPWLDVANYVLAPDGTLESGGAGWSLSGGAAVVEGNETFFVHGPGETKSLALPAGSAAQSAAMCVGIEHPTLRFFVKRTGGSPLASLRVEVVYENHLGALETLPIGVTGASGDWSPSPVMVISASLLPLLPGEHTPVAFRFVPQGSASWQVDDVYVDPYIRR